jgi:sugar phosphate permease
MSDAARDDGIRTYGYRWVVLALFALLNVLIEVHWVTFAAITTESAAFYGVSILQIGLLSMLFMLVYLAVSLPASYVIDTRGVRAGAGFAALLIAVFGLAKGLFPSSYTVICVAQIGLAVAQPFVVNAYTRLSACWFPLEERATATGISSLAQYLGIIVAVAGTPFLFHAFGMGGMLFAYGVASAAGALAFLVFFRGRPPTPPCTAAEEARLAFGAGLKHILRQRDMRILLALFFVGLGIFNAVTTWIEQIVSPRGFHAEQAGVAGGLMIVGGIVGAAILPVLSDRLRRRRSILLICMTAAVPGILGLTFATSLPLLLASAFVLGCAIMSAGPIGFQYGAEVTYPAPESSSQGFLLLAGQASGVLFIIGMDSFRSAGGSMTPFLVAFVVLMTLSALGCLALRESSLMEARQPMGESGLRAS